jgi:hypothetical protein
MESARNTDAVDPDAASQHGLSTRASSSGSFDQLKALRSASPQGEK